MTRVVPKRALGQHFLADPNILAVIARLAQLEPNDVVLEVGPGLGVLTTHLADRVEVVHAVELDRSLERPLREALGSRDNVRLFFGDAMRLDLGDLDPKPTKLVSNLPYNIATPLIVEGLSRPSSLESWCVMVQREVADRLFAVPSTKAYGAVSVIVRLTARRTGFHPVSRHVFRPPPRVDSALVAFERITPPPDLAGLRRLIDAAFGHRRKTLANAVALAGLATRAEVAETLAGLGHPPSVRAEALDPDQFVALRDALAR